MLALGVFVVSMRSTRCSSSHAASRAGGRPEALPFGVFGGLFGALFGSGGFLYSLYLNGRLASKSRCAPPRAR